MATLKPLLASLALISACTSAPEEAGRPPESTEMVFFDSTVFDQRLSKILDSGSPSVTIKFQGDVRLDELPDRMDTWISLIDKNGGTVTLLKTGEQSSVRRGLVSDSVELLFEGVTHLKQQKTFRPIADYDAKLYYETDGTVQKIELKRH